MDFMKPIYDEKYLEPIEKECKSYLEEYKVPGWVKFRKAVLTHPLFLRLPLQIQQKAMLLETASYIKRKKAKNSEYIMGQTRYFGYYISSVAVDYMERLEANYAPNNAPMPRSRQEEKEYIRKSLAPNSNAPLLCGDSGYVYVFVDETRPGLYKIGKTASVADRLKGMQSAAPHTKAMFSKFVTDMTMEERKLHNLYSDVRDLGEWFKLTDEQLKEIQKYFEDIV
jgi:hypothetical protein